MRIFSGSKITFVIIAFVVVTFTPASVFARESTTEGTTSGIKKEAQNRTNKTTENKCEAIDKTAEKIKSQLEERVSKIETKRTAIVSDMHTKQSERDKEIATKRAQWDKLRQSNFEKLRSKAVTTEQKAAVEEYIVSMKKAIVDRRNANDTAIATFRSEVNALKAVSKQSVESSISTTSLTVDQAITDAKAACVSGQSSPEVVRQNLKKALDQIRTQSKSARESMTKNEQLKTAINKRNEAIQANAEAFEQATKEAREKLRSAFEN